MSARALECELIDRRAFRTQAEARMAIFEFIEGWYNPRRRHSALGYLSPNDFERAAATGATRPTPAYDHHDRMTEPGTVAIDDLDAHNGPHGLPYSSVLGKTSRPPAITHLSAGDESPNVSTQPGNSTRPNRHCTRCRIEHAHPTEACSSLTGDPKSDDAQCRIPMPETLILRGNSQFRMRNRNAKCKNSSFVENLVGG